MNKRRHQRIEVQNAIAYLSDEVNAFSGNVSDVSHVGMLLTDIPNELNSQGKKFSIIVSAKGKDYKMLVVPKWISGKHAEKKMGLEILDDPFDWSVFVMNCEPADEDIWAATTHLPDC
jgi:hypothetical protein